MKQTIGTCSICGGPVTVPFVYWSVAPPVPACEQCGATPRAHGPVIDMQPRQDPWTKTTWGNTSAITTAVWPRKR
jgi:hypothetical protein